MAVKSGDVTGKEDSEKVRTINLKQPPVKAKRKNVEMVKLATGLLVSFFLYLWIAGAFLDIVKVVTLSQTVNSFLLSSLSILLFFAHDWVVNFSNGRLLISYRGSGDVGGDDVEQQLVNAAFQIVNAFLANSLVHGALTSVGVSASILRRNKIAVHFMDSYKYFGKQYAYSWIDPGNFDLYTVVFDSAFLVRYRTLASMGDTASGERILEMRWIELFIAIKLLHELAHLGFRGTFSHLLVDDKTPGHANGGENGNHLERLDFGGVASFIWCGPNARCRRWNGEREFIGIIIKNIGSIDRECMEHICAQYRQARPDAASLLPLRCSPVNLRRGERITSSPEGYIVELDNGHFTIPSVYLCGIRHARNIQLPRPRILDFAESGGSDAGSPPMTRAS